MRVLEPQELDKRRQYRAKKQKSKRRHRRYFSICFIILLVYTVGVMLMPLPALRSDVMRPKLPPPQVVNMPWPNYGQTAIGAVGYGVLAQNGVQHPLPIASVAKVITAVAVLKARPMATGSAGGVITITAEDEAIYNQYLAEGQSIVEVKAGEQITQYQALQALLLPSANNMADVLVRWAFGPKQAYLTYANNFTKTLGMTQTNIDDASGFSPRTTSVAKDLVLLAEIAMNSPIIAEIVRQPQADLPVAGTVYNVNSLLGQQGITGIKTGNTEEAGGCYLFSASQKVDETHSVTVVGAIVGAPERSVAMEDALRLLSETHKNFRVVTPLLAQDEVGSIYRKGGSKVPIVVAQVVTVVIWNAQEIRADAQTANIKKHVSKGDPVGSVLLRVGNMTYDLPIVAGGSSSNDGLLWRLRHASGYL